jgi:hypothetical protein
MSIKKFKKENKDDYKEYYCKIILNDNIWNGFFEMKNIQKDYHFFINPEFIYENEFNNINEVGSIFIVKNTVYFIKFNFLYH